MTPKRLTLALLAVLALTMLLYPAPWAIWLIIGALVTVGIEKWRYTNAKIDQILAELEEEARDGREG